jgi:lipoate-protein ligase B
MSETIAVIDLGRMPYRQAWELQEQAHEAVANGGGETIFIVEHPAVITLGRRGETAGTLVASAEELARQGIEVVNSDRGGDITFHGPGQVVAYPIIRLAGHRFSVSGYVHTLEKIVIGVLGEIGIAAYTDREAVGVWVKGEGEPAKICAIGVRIRRGVTLHGLALNVSTDLSGFANIVPCGLVGRGVTSIQKVLGEKAPSFDDVKRVLGRRLSEGLAGIISSTGE